MNIIEAKWKNNLKELRKKAAKNDPWGYSQQSVAESIGCALPSYARWEEGHVLPRYEWIPRIAEVLGCKVEDISFKCLQK